ncbi:MAG: hypothetical protein JXR76_32685 [Deltaproteobacteria bacterium]|nr:hypothetical protein [Deltaproteobacteria bacterium]
MRKINHLCICLAIVGITFFVGHKAMANPIASTVDFDIWLNENGTAITAGYLGMFKPGEFDYEAFIIRVKIDDEYVIAGENWEYDENVTIANGGSGDEEFHEISMVVPCPAPGKQTFEITNVYENRDGEIRMYEMLTKTVVCDAAGTVDTDSEQDTAQSDPEQDSERDSEVTDSESDDSDDSENESTNDDDASENDGTTKHDGASGSSHETDTAGASDSKGCSFFFAYDNGTHFLFQLLLSIW